MRMYRCTVDVKTYVAVEAETLAEAERKIDDVLRGCDEVHLHEDGGDFNGGATLVGSRSNISRGRVMVEN